MKKLIFLLFLLVALLFCTPVEIEPEYCWTCESVVTVTYSIKKPTYFTRTVIHESISEYCNRTESWIQESIKDCTWKSTLISQGDTVLYDSSRKCNKQ